MRHHIAALLFCAGATAQNSSPCPKVNVLDQSNAANISMSVELVSGCSYTVEFEGVHEERYLRIPRRDTTERLSVEWDFENAASTIFFYDWEQPPTYNPTGITRYQWYKAPLAGEGAYTFRTDGVDGARYTCSGDKCAGDRVASREGPLYITLSNQPASGGSVYSGTVKFEFTPPYSYINPDARRSLQTLWNTCCKPYYYLDVEPYWTANLWRHGNDNPPMEPHGYDYDETPYCSWDVMGGDVQPGDTPGDRVATVLGWDDVTDYSCDDLQHVQCDAHGNIVELSLAGLGLKCDQMPAMPGLAVIVDFHISLNSIAGTLPDVLLQSTTLRSLLARHNQLTGLVPCPASDALQELHLDANKFTGTVPSCLFRKPALEQLLLSSNFLEGGLPENWGLPPRFQSKLLALQINNANLGGTLPANFEQMPTIATVELNQNRISGSLPPSLFSAPRTLYRLSLSHNELTGTLPAIAAEMTALKVVHLDNNKLEGEIVDQFAGMVQHQVDNLASSVWLQSNAFSGALPPVTKTITLGEPYVQLFDISDNHFRCERDTRTWPSWAMRLNQRSVLGTCEPIPRIDRIEPAAAPAGATVSVYGSGFRATDNFRCKFGAVATDALFDSPSRARCIVPELPQNGAGDAMQLTMSNYGEDWSSAALLADYTPTGFTLGLGCGAHGTFDADAGVCACEHDASGDWEGEHCETKSTNPFLLALVLVLLGVASAFAAFIYILVKKEKKGSPLFAPLMERMEESSGAGGFAMMTVAADGPAAPGPPPGLPPGDVL